MLMQRKTYVRTALLVGSGLLGLRIGLWLGVTIGIFAISTNQTGLIITLVMGAILGAGLAYRDMEN